MMDRTLNILDSDSTVDTTVKGVYTDSNLNFESNSTRLVHLLPGEEFDLIQCNLRTVNLDHHAGFEALSYVWGDQNDQRTIVVNGAPLQVGENLFTVLKSLRKCDSERVMWIDALSINQGDLAERNDQVRMMARIYQCAKHVLAWLGPETAASRKAFEFLSRSYFGSPINRHRLVEDHEWVAMKDLYQREYWKRVWIVQEVCLAREVVLVCGTTQLPWAYASELYKARKHVWTGYLSSGELDFRRSRMAKISDVRNSSQTKGCNLWMLLQSFRGSSCHVIHDKIYGFLGLAADNSNNIVQVDYSKPLPELFDDVIRFHYKKFQQDASSPNSGQLMAFAEFLHAYFSDHPNYCSELDQQQCFEGRVSIPARLSTSVFAVLEIRGVPTADEARELGAADLTRYLDGAVPYSHLSYWREKIDSNLTNVYPIASSRTRAALDSRVEAPRTGQRLSLSKGGNLVVTARYLRPKALPSEPTSPSFDVVTIVPPGTYCGDIICSFVESQVALVMREMLRPGSNVYTLVGRAHLDFDQLEKMMPIKTRLQSHEWIESTTARESGDESVAWPATVFIDMDTLKIATKGSKRRRPQRQEGSQLDVRAVPNTTPSSTAFQKLNSEQRKRLEGQHAQHRRAPAVGIYNLGATGYLSCALQILYHLKPFRDILLDPRLVPESGAMSALIYVFNKLQYGSLPVSPAAVVASFGWETRHANEMQDFFEFWTIWVEKLGKWPAISSICEKYLALQYWEQSQSGGRLTSDGACITFRLSAGEFVPAMREACKMGGVRDERPEVGLRTTQYRCIPPILMLQAKVLEYDFKTDAMMPITNRFEFPASFDFASIADVSDEAAQDTQYQLHGIVLLEDVNPPRWMLYLRSREEDKWLLFFNESVTHATHQEVFEDVYTRGQGDPFKKKPLRSASVLMYLRKSMLSELLY